MNNSIHKKTIQSFIGESKDLCLIGPLKTPSQYLEVYFSSNKNTPIICVDGGKNYVTGEHLSIGDGDSSNSSCHLNFDLNKDFTDLEGLLSYIDQPIKNIHAFGFIGGRLDHQLVVIQNFFAISERLKCMIKLYQNESIAIYPEGEHLVQINGLFSLISYKPTEISLEGDCRYLAKNLQIQPYSGIGLSNIGTGKIKIKNNHSIAIFGHESLENK